MEIERIIDDDDELRLVSRSHEEFYHVNGFELEENLWSNSRENEREIEGRGFFCLTFFLWQTTMFCMQSKLWTEVGSLMQNAFSLVWWFNWIWLSEHFYCFSSMSSSNLAFFLLRKIPMQWNFHRDYLTGVSERERKWFCNFIPCRIIIFDCVEVSITVMIVVNTSFSPFSFLMRLSLVSVGFLRK